MTDYVQVSREDVERLHGLCEAVMRRDIIVPKNDFSCLMERLSTALSAGTVRASLPSPPVSGEAWPERRLPEGWWVHELKTWPDAFDAMHDGRKLFEFRKHDRDYRVGDQILSRRFDPTTKDYTGECDRFEVTFMLVAGQYGVPDGFCVMGVKPSSTITNEPVGVTTREEWEAAQHALAELEMWACNGNRHTRAATVRKVLNRLPAAKEPPIPLSASITGEKG